MKLRILHGLLSLLTFALLAAIVAFQYLKSSLPEISGTLHLSGAAAHQLRVPAEVVRDRFGVPHIYAGSLRDANFALGFVHAQDRLWQMEMNRRISAGRLSELFGPSSLDTDRFLRTLGIHRVARATLEMLDAETRELFDAYAAGVNAFLAANDKPLPVEFVLLGHRPEPWSAVDSLAWIKMMAWDLSGNWRDELLRMQLAGRITTQQIQEFLPPYPGDAAVPLPDLTALYASLANAATKIAAAVPEQPPEGIGSNNWVVAGSRTNSGKPLLANDPHLGLTAPAVWYFAHLDSPGARLIGSTLPGVPMVVLGRNERIAWGFTNTGPDVQDLYIERLDPVDAALYDTPTGKRRFVTLNEVIKIKGQPDLTLAVRISRHGPIISDAFADAAKAMPQGYALAFAWTTLQEDDFSAQALTRLGRARDWEGFLAAARDFHSPQQNILYADVDGNIGYLAPGRVPIRRSDNDLMGLAPSLGWEAKYDWQGFIPFDELPRQYNPVSGTIATANEKITPPGYPHWISSHWEPPFRARRIAELLAAREHHDLAGFAAMQADVRSLYAREVLPLLLAVPPASEAGRSAAALLQHWDGELLKGRTEPLIVNAWLRELTRLVYSDELGELFAANWTERPIFMLNVLRDQDGQGRWCNDIRTPPRETCAEMIARALDLALADLSRRYGADLGQWRWGEAHVAVSDHRPFSKRAWLAPLFELRQPVSGDTWTINVGRGAPGREEQPFAARHAASLRALYDLSGLDRSLYMFSSGQSGNPFSPFYRNLNAAWARVEYIPMSMRRADIENQQLGTLRLLPP
ncbi:MAG: penicillin acylase family protein [Rhodocyclaceae bacterium]|nr:MAG: penicillin acylase family protein [Rhodocyclaceae bacterium]